MKRINLQIVAIDERDESQINDIDQIFKKIIKGNFPKLRKNMLIQGT